MSVVGVVNMGDRMRPEEQHYDAVEEIFLRSIAEGQEFLFDCDKFEAELRRLWEEYDFPYQSLQSLVRNLHVSYVKKRAPAIRKDLPAIIQEYVSGNSIRNLARKVNFPPCLLARYVVEAITEKNLGGGKKALAEAMRYPLRQLGSIEVIAAKYHASERITTTETTTRLAREVAEAVNFDPMYGPRHEKERYMVGVEYEVVLEFKLKALRIPYENEEQLRNRGTSRTPDVLLSTPLGIQVVKKDGNGMEWKMITWIDSKALFGDVNTHQTSVLPQAESYVHRFGPGLVLYWFGHAPKDRLSDAQGDISIVGWDLPSLFMLPTRNFVGKTAPLFF